MWVAFRPMLSSNQARLRSAPGEQHIARRVILRLPTQSFPQNDFSRVPLAALFPRVAIVSPHTYSVKQVLLTLGAALRDLCQHSSCISKAQ